MFTIGGLIVGFLAGIAATYYVFHKANPTATQVVIDSGVDQAKAAVKVETDKLN